MRDLHPITDEMPRWTKARPVDDEDREAEVGSRIRALAARALGTHSFRSRGLTGRDDVALDAAAS